MLRVLLVLSCVAATFVACDSDPAGSSCVNGRQDPDESGVDCGGPCEACDAAATCVDGVQNQGEIGVDCGGPCPACSPGTCVDGVQNQGEAGVDCGGPCPACAAATCVDGVQNQGEAGVDCGGPCPACAAATCVDGVQNQGEAGVDCGGPCPACAAATCVDGVQNQGEAGVDCGGPCPACSAGTCADGVQNQGEAGVDCGGPCPACAPAATCSDGVRNQDESDVDCGGRCPTCGNGAACGLPADCASGICASGTCSAPAPSCTDEETSGDETDVDCGGTCPPCATGASCGVANDCDSAVCAGGTCQDPTCSDGVRNGFEADVDCGPGCDGCADGAACGFDQDCASGICDDGTCVSCDDGERNGTESDVDCGGEDCGACTLGDSCGGASDCVSGACSGGVCVCDGDDDCGDGTCGVGGQCQLPTCSDGKRNQDETDVDCGGSCPPCGLGDGCVVQSDCQPRFECYGGGCGHARIEVVAGEAFTCALVTNFLGQVYCWGDNSSGQLGLGDTQPRSRPTRVPGLTNVESLSAGAQHVCAKLEDGTIACWGDDTYGQCGDGTVGGGDILSPQVIPGFVAHENAWVTSGRHHNCVLDEQAEAYCWGRGHRGQLGTGARTDEASPTRIATYYSVLDSLSAGGDHTCGFHGNHGDPYCWGDNQHGQVTGYLTYPNAYRTLPEKVELDMDAYPVAGGQMTCVVQVFTATPDVECFGWYATLNTATFVAAITDGSNDLKVDCSVTGDRCCAVLDEPGARCWDGESAPAAVTGVTDAYDVVVGGEHVCFVFAGSTVRCFGDNTSGQLGRGTVGGEELELDAVAGFVDPSCGNGLHDFGEDGVDCGGPCQPCAAATCSDGQQNQGETGVDCGGPCPACGGGTCSDQVQNQGEERVDCGGPCAACPTITSIASIQQSTASTGCTTDQDITIAGGPLTIEGVITVDSYPLTGTLHATFVSDGTQSPWSATTVRFPTSEGWSFSAGQRVRLTGFHHEYFCHTQFRVTGYQLIGTATVPAPKAIAKGLTDSELEQWEGVTVRIDDVNVTGHNAFDDALTDAGVLVDGYIMRDAFPLPAVGTNLPSVVGVLVYGFDVYRVAPRTAADL